MSLEELSPSRSLDDNLVELGKHYNGISGPKQNAMSGEPQLRCSGFRKG